MIRFTFTDKDDHQVLCLGITEENVKRMKDGKPVVIDCHQMGIVIDGSVSIFYGETEQVLYDAVKEFIGPETEIHISDRVDLKR